MTETTNAEIRQVLLDTRQLIGTPERWTQGHFARNSSGQVVSAQAINASCWCLCGAAIKVTEISGDFYSARRVLHELIGSNGWLSWNDDPNRTHPEVLELLDKAIAKVTE